MSFARLSVSFPPRLWVRCGERDRVHLVAVTKALNLREPKQTKAGPNDSLMFSTNADEPWGVLRLWGNGLITRTQAGSRPGSKRTTGRKHS